MMRRLLALLAAVTFCYYVGSYQYCNTTCYPTGYYGQTENCQTY